MPFDSEITAVVAVAEVNFPAGVPTFVFNRGFTAVITDNGVGDTTLNLPADEGLSDAVRYSHATVKGTTPEIIAVNHLSNLQIQITTETNAGVAVDADFMLEVKRITTPT